MTDSSSAEPRVFYSLLALGRAERGAWRAAARAAAAAESNRLADFWGETATMPGKQLKGETERQAQKQRRIGDSPPA
jgi:hypothetical protein